MSNATTYAKLESSWQYKYSCEKAFATPQVLYDVGPSQTDQLYLLIYDSPVHYTRYFIHDSQGVSCIPPPPLWTRPRKPTRLHSPTLCNLQFRRFSHLYRGNDIPAHCAKGELSIRWHISEYSMLLSLSSPSPENSSDDLAFASFSCTQSKTKWIKVWQNFPWIPTVGCFKLVICPSSCAGIEFGQFRPSEIWQPWSSKFGNPEKQNSDSWVFKLPEQ